MLLRSNFSSFPQYFQYINFMSEITYTFVKCCCSIYSFFSILQLCYFYVRISRSISENPWEFEITRVECNIKYVYETPQPLNSDTKRKNKQIMTDSKQDKPQKSTATSSLLGPVVQSIVSLTSSLVVKMLTDLVITIPNLQVFLLKQN